MPNQHKDEMVVTFLDDCCEQEMEQGFSNRQISNRSIKSILKKSG